MSYNNPIPKIEEHQKSEISEQQLDYVCKEKVYFAFIDVLGFKKSYDDKKITKDNSFIKKYQDVFNYYFELMNHSMFMNTSDKQCYAGQTSDSLYFYTERIDFLMKFIDIFNHFNLYAMSKNVFFRGGISQGELFKKENYQFFGDSVIGAYLLESNISKFPIITIDENTYNDLKAIKDLNNMINTQNGRYYINPFYSLHENTQLDIVPEFDLEDVDCESIQRHILNNKSIFEYDANNYSKYSFLEKEYNECMKSQKNGILGGANE